MPFHPSPRPQLKEIHVQAPVGIPTGDGGLEIPNRIFLGGIPTETTELDLEQFFSEFGAVKDVRIVSDRITGQCKGYGFVTFEEQVDISTFFRRKTVSMRGHRLRVRKAIRRNGSSQFKENSPDSETVEKHFQNSTIQAMPPPPAFPTSPLYMVSGIPQPLSGIPGQVPYPYGMTGVHQPVTMATNTPTCQCSTNTVYPLPMYYSCQPIPNGFPVFQYQ